MDSVDKVHLRLDRVTKKFGPLTVVDEVTLEIPQGKFVTLLGPSGCGKTTLLRMIAGFYEPDGGAIYLSGRRIDRLPAHQRGAAMVFQDYALFPHMTVGDNVGYGLRLAGVSRPEIKRRVAETLRFVGLDGLAERWPNQLSGGQQQRVALARALIVEPQVLLLDEPLSNLDANLRERMRWELRALQRRLNMSFLYVTHDQNEALAMSDWMAVMNGGHLEQWGTPYDIYHCPGSTFIAEFIGSANLRPATVLSHDGQTLQVELHGQRFAVQAPPRPIDGDSVLLCIRPEALTLDQTIRHADCVNLAGTIRRSAFLGSVTRYWISVDDQEWLVDTTDVGAAALPDGGAVVISFHPHRVHIIPDP
jgi:ABC-type Fe3+/spermidine/putrescine transport system ATPase subunit